MSAKAVGRLDTGLSEFFMRYGAVLEAVATRVHRLAPLSKRWVSSQEVAEWVAKDLPALYTRTFGRGGALPLRAWRVRSMLSIASYLGAFEALDIRVVRGKGLQSKVKARPHLRVVR